jgi:hypothetical protein
MINFKKLAMIAGLGVAFANTAQADLALRIELKDSSGNVATNYVKGQEYTVNVVGEHSSSDGTSPNRQIDFGLTTDGMFSKVVQPGVDGKYSNDFYRDSGAMEISDISPRFTRRKVESKGARDIEGLVASFRWFAPEDGQVANIGFTNALAYGSLGRQDLELKNLALKSSDYLEVKPLLDFRRNWGHGEEGQGVMSIGRKSVVFSAPEVTGTYTPFYTNNTDRVVQKPIPFTEPRRFYKSVSLD